MAAKRLHSKIKAVSGNCPFCRNAGEPDYKNYTELAKFISDRAKIIGRNRSGVCPKHQRRLAIEIKRARHLGLLPFSDSL